MMGEMPELTMVPMSTPALMMLNRPERSSSTNHAATIAWSDGKLTPSPNPMPTLANIRRGKTGAAGTVKCIAYDPYTDTHHEYKLPTPSLGQQATDELSEDVAVEEAGEDLAGLEFGGEGDVARKDGDGDVGTVGGNRGCWRRG